VYNDISGTVVPEIEENIPLPASAADEMPQLSPKEELDMRARTIKLLADINGDPITPSEEQKEVAQSLAKQMMQDPQMRPDYAKYPNEVMAYLAGMVSQSNCMLVDELSDLKMYVVNKLVYEIEHARDSKSRIAALSKLGEVDGVDAFKKRSEVTMKVQSIEEVEKELLITLEALEGVDYKREEIEKIEAAEEIEEEELCLPDN
jgi:uncharacterized protein YhaN